MPPDPPAPDTDSTTPTFWAAMGVSAFRWFMLGSFLSNVGNQMRTLVVGWDVYHRTGEPVSLGFVGLVLAMPVLLLALPAGVAADRYSRKWIIVVSQSGRALCGLGLVWATQTHADLRWIYLLLLGTGTFRALGWPAMVAIVTQLVPARLFPNAVTWRSIAFQGAATLGPLLGGFLLKGIGSANVYLLDSLAGLFFIACLLIVHIAPQQRATGVKSWHSLIEGVRFVRHQPLILSTITLDMIAVLFGGATALLPIFATDILQVGETGFGWLRAMPSLGAIAMGLFLALFNPIKRAGRVLIITVIVFGVATIVFGLSKDFKLSMAALFVLGAADNVSVVIRSTLIQLLTPDYLRGRVAAVNAIFINTSNEIGEFESGLAAHWLGTITAVAGGGLMTLLTVGGVVLKWPSLLKMGRLEELTPQTIAERGTVQGKPIAETEMLMHTPTSEP